MYCLHHQLLSLSLSLKVAYSGDSFKLVSATVGSCSAGLFSLVGVYGADLLVNWHDNVNHHHPKITRRGRLVMLGLCCIGEVCVRGFESKCVSFGVYGRVSRVQFWWRSSSCSNSCVVT